MSNDPLTTWRPNLINRKSLTACLYKIMETVTSSILMCVCSSYEDKACNPAIHFS